MAERSCVADLIVIKFAKRENCQLYNTTEQIFTDGVESNTLVVILKIVVLSPKTFLHLHTCLNVKW